VYWFHPLACLRDVLSKSSVSTYKAKDKSGYGATRGDIKMGIIEDTGGGCSICGDIPANHIQGTYWLCDSCENDATRFPHDSEPEPEEGECGDPWHHNQVGGTATWKCPTCGYKS